MGVDDGGDDAAAYDYKPLSPELINYYTQYLLESNYTSNDFIDYADLLQELSENAGVKASTPKKLDLSKYGIRRENVDRTIPRDNYPTQQLNLSYNMFRSFPPNFFDQFENLTHLWLHHNRIVRLPEV